MKLNKLEKLVVVLIAVISVSTLVVSSALAEQQGSSPDSQVDSILKEVYDSLVELGYGSEEGSNGSMWNRIISSANWTPSSGISSSQVLKDVEYYEGNRSIKTGTLDFPKYEDMSLQAKDFRDSNASTTWATWTKTNASPEVWKDERTGLYWSSKQEDSTNEFTVSSCDFYTSVPRGNYDGTDTDCGTAINTCGTLSLDADGDSIPETDWYLPTQAELMQAYLNGIYMSTGTSWVSTSGHWSSTEYQSNTTHACYTSLHIGYTYVTTKTTTYSVRCVHRD